MRKFMMLLTALTLCLTACHDDDEPEGYTPAARASRTVLVYMSGENNLTVTSGVRFLYNDLQEIIEGSKVLGADQRLLVFVDSLNTNSQQSSTPFIIEVHDGKARELYKYDHHFYASDPANFREVIDRAFAYAPADSYGLVLWGHATGWLVDEDSIASASSRPRRAYGVDYGRNADPGNPYKWMNITQMARALVGLPKLAFIFADCCNMMCAEVGYELRNATDYLIGSPAEIPGDGAPYHLLQSALFKDGEQMYKGIIDTYYNHYLERSRNSYSLPLSVISTQHIEALAQATHDVLTQFEPACPVYPKYPDMRKDSIVLYLHADYDAPVMYDMRAFVKANTSDEVFRQWDAYYQRAVPYYRMSMVWTTMYSNMMADFSTFKEDESVNGCVSMYVPQNTTIYNSSSYCYNQTFNQMEWNRVIDWTRFGWGDTDDNPW